MTRETVINMDEHLEMNDALSSIAENRYAMPPVVVAAFRQAGQKGVLKLLSLVEGEDFDKLPIPDKLKVLEMIFDRAYGKAETATTSLNLLHKSGKLGEGNGQHGNRLSEIEKRMLTFEEGFPELEQQQAARQSKSPARATPARPGGSPQSGAGGQPADVFERLEHYDEGVEDEDDNDTEPERNRAVTKRVNRQSATVVRLHKSA